MNNSKGLCSMNRTELTNEIKRVEQALNKTTSRKLKHDYGRYLKRLYQNLNYYDKHRTSQYKPI